MDFTSSEVLHKALAERLAKLDISDDRLAGVAGRIAKNGMKVGGMRFCPYGICIDYFTDRDFSIDELVKGLDYRELKIFTHGIPVIDLYRVNVEVKVPEFEGFGRPG